MRSFLALLFLAVLPAVAQEAAAPPSIPSVSVRLDGAVKASATYSIAELAAMPGTSVTASFQGHEGATGTWKGVLLTALIAKVGTVEEKGHGAYLQHVIVARGSDGYGVAIAMGEIDAKFEGKPVIVAYEKDGAQLSSLRLIIPGDAHAGRAVHDLVELTLR